MIAGRCRNPLPHANKWKLRVKGARVCVWGGLLLLGCNRFPPLGRPRPNKKYHLLIAIIGDTITISFQLVLPSSYSLIWLELVACPSLSTPSGESIAWLLKRTQHVTFSVEYSCDVAAPFFLSNLPLPLFIQTQTHAFQCHEQ